MKSYPRTKNDEKKKEEEEEEWLTTDGEHWEEFYRRCQPPMTRGPHFDPFLSPLLGTGSEAGRWNVARNAEISNATISAKETEQRDVQVSHWFNAVMLILRISLHYSKPDVFKLQHICCIF